MLLDALSFAQIWVADFEFGAGPGENPDPVCLVAWELRSGLKVKIWRDAFGTAPPYSTGPDALFVAFYASAEIACHLALGWPVPERVLDLFTEFRNHTNGLPTVSGASLLGALAFYGLDGIGTAEKDDMRALVLRGGPWSDSERGAILDYCESDVAALARLLPTMLPSIDLPRALLRGRYMAAAARIERNGVPIDIATLERLKRHWFNIQDQLIAEIDADYGVFEGRTFKPERFARWLERIGIPWPTLASGRLDLSDDAFREVARAHPVVAPLRELRGALSEMRLSDLAVGRDGRNRTLLSERPQGEPRLPWLHVRPATLPEGRPLVPGRKPVQRSVQRIKAKVGDILVSGNKEPWPTVSRRLNRLLLGWSAYFGYGTRMPAYRAVDNHVYDRVRAFLRKRHNVQGRGTRRFSDAQVFGGFGVLRLRRVHLGPPPCASG